MKIMYAYLSLLNEGQLLMCVKHGHLGFQTNQPSTRINEEVLGNQFYRFVDAQKQTDLQVSMNTHTIPTKSHYFTVVSHYMRA